MTRRYLTVSPLIAPLLRRECVEAADRLARQRQECSNQWFDARKEAEREEIRRAVTAYQRAGGAIKIIEPSLEQAIASGAFDPISCFPKSYRAKRRGQHGS